MKTIKANTEKITKMVLQIKTNVNQHSWPFDGTHELFRRCTIISCQQDPKGHFIAYYPLSVFRWMALLKMTAISFTFISFSYLRLLPFSS